MSRRTTVVIAAVAAVVIVLGVVSFAAWPRGATPVSEAEALDDFRRRTTTPVGSEAGTGLPAPGVYRFASSGHEEVKLGPLPAESRTYPDSMPVVIVADQPGCFTTTLNLIEQHREETTYCTDGDGGLRIDAHRKEQQVGAVSPTATMTCDPAEILVAGSSESDLSCTLSLSGGPAQLTAQLIGTARRTDPTTAIVDGASYDAVAVDISLEISGDLSGSWQEKIWFARADWMPLRIERSFDLRGLATFSEESTLELVDLEPTL